MATVSAGRQALQQRRALAGDAPATTGVFRIALRVIVQAGLMG